jgi:serine/threonine protein kinase
MIRDPEIDRRLAAFVERHVRDGAVPSLEAICADRPDLVPALRALAATYLEVNRTLDGDAAAGAVTVEPPLPAIEGFQTIERIGAGGMGEVFKLRDLTLDRLVAAKVVRRGRAAAVGDFLREARALALFQDRRIVQVYEFRPDADPPVIIMELVEGFELGRIGPSLEVRQRARVLLEVCEAVGHAHALGLQHRDLKPSNIMLDAGLAPRILDFGLCSGDPSRGHFVGTPAYLAPEQLDPAAPIDARTDVYALGVILYELLCGVRPYGAAQDDELIAAILRGQPRLPVEIDPQVPEPLQAIALKAMERDPAGRYPSASEMALDLRRFLDSRPVLARPSLYASALGTRVRPHLEQIAEWLRLKLIYPHEADRLRSAYRQLDAREDDWIVESRTLSYSQIALYLGAYLLVIGSLFYFAAHRFYDAITGVLRPFAVLAVPFIGLNLAAHHLYRREHKAVAVAFYLAGVGLLPLFLLILFSEAGIFVAPSGVAGQLFPDGEVSNRQLQATILAGCAWCGWLALRTRTAALSTVCTVLLFLLGLAVLADVGLRQWIEDQRFDRLAVHLSPMIAVYGAAAAALERSGRPWFGRPLYLAAAVLFVAVLELLALDGRELGYLGFSLQHLQGPDVAQPALIDTLTAMTINGVAIYAAASALERYGSELTQSAARLLFTISPFAMIQPVGYLSKTGEYALGFDWLYAGAAAAIALLSHRRQRKSFYYAGLLNTGVGLYLIADHRDWFDRPAWAMVVIGAGLAALIAGFWLHRRETMARSR